MHWLRGAEPKQNREIPPLRYALVHRLKHDFPALKFSLNGGITLNAQVHEHLRLLDGVMVGREAYHNPGGWPSGTRSSSARRPRNARARRSRP